MNCPQQELIENYIQGKLTLQELAEFEAHLQNCKKCQSIVAEARENEKLLIEIRTFERTSSEPRESTNKEIYTVEQAQTLLGERYRVIRKIGEGAAGHVFQVADTVLDRLVAVKFLRNKTLTDDTDSKRWQEARLMSQLNHPSVAQVYEIGQIEEQRFIVMEWVDGLPLTDAWNELPLQQNYVSSSRNCPATSGFDSLTDTSAGKKALPTCRIWAIISSDLEAGGYGETFDREEVP